MYRLRRYDEVEAEYKALIEGKEWWYMVIREYPEEIKKYMAIYEPYSIQIYQGKLEGVPQEAIDAYNKVKKWAWEQGQ